MKKLVKVICFLTMFGLLFIIFPKKTDAAKEIEIPKGVLVTDNQGVSLTKSEGYFFNLKDLFPGDSVVREVEIKNNRSEEVGMKIDIVPLSFTGPVNLIKLIDMKWTYDDKVIFNGNLVSQDKNEFEKGSSIDLGKIPANTIRKLKIDLYVSPEITIKDLIKAESEAVVRWDVKATANDVKEPKVEPLVKVTTNKGILPKTGEKLTIFLSVLALLSILLVIVVRNKLYTKTDT
ncbi:LPXTG cell wall anchor domain-containing protein [Vagococcus sp.]|uniref:LPXTG cell wall anchor domain-containing protein n=1 Tax=Vagococcus sp. TaxID=1933889 RepID=UPI002FCB5DDC